MFMCTLLACLMLQGCGTSITAFTDKGSHAEIIRMRGNRLAGGITSVELNVQRYEKREAPSISLIVIYTGPFFLNLEEGKSLALTIDGTRVDISGAGSCQHREHVSLGLIQETAYYHEIDPEMIRSIAYAHQVHVELSGSSGVVRRHFNDGNFRHFKEFFERHIENVHTAHE